LEDLSLHVQFIIVATEKTREDQYIHVVRNRESRFSKDYVCNGDKNTLRKGLMKKLLRYKYILIKLTRSTAEFTLIED